MIGPGQCYLSCGIPWQCLFTAMPPLVLLVVGDAETQMESTSGIKPNYPGLCETGKSYDDDVNNG